MTRTTKIAIAVLPLILIGFFVVRGMRDKASENTNADVPGENINEAPTPKRVAGGGESTAGPVAVPALVDNDPIGSLRLEGQVVDEEERPVGGATVALGSSPPRTTTTEADGTFVFDKLVGRRYPVYARSSDRIGGPVIVTLAEDTPPVIVHLQVGGGIEVEVLDEQNRPIVGATVTMPVLESITAQTNSQGVAALRNLPPGQSVVSASAPGYTSATSLVVVPRGADALGHQRMTLLHGYKVAGVVVDHQGKPVANAKVIARAVGALLQLEDPRKVGVSSDDDGRFELPSVPSGSMQLFAVHDDYAPSTSERFSVSASDVSGIKLIIREGASIAGSVVTQGGEPVPWATIRVLSPPGQSSFGSGVNRERIAEEDGSFKIKGIPREQVVVHGASELASSEGLEVDLRAKSKAKGLNIVLTIEGTIRGSVVDEDGEPVAEVQVLAYPDIWKGADMEQMRVRGPAFATTAGDGSFTLHGLPDGRYRVVASRVVARDGSNGTPAQTGDQSVLVVLASPGRIIGEIRFSDGSTPKLASISVAYEPGVPTSNGRFELIDLPPSTYEVAVRGPNFTATFIPNVELKAGETLDLGTVSVQRGRSVQGQVLGPSGQPIAGAEVVLARQLVSDGSALTPKDLGAAMDFHSETRRTATTDNGHYILPGIGAEEWTIASDHPEVGRSIAQKVAAGLEDVTLNIVLKDVGSIRGSVSVNGALRPGVQVLVTSTESAGQHMVIVSSDERGRFFADRVSVGEHKVSAVVGSGGGSSMAATLVVVEAGAESEALLDIEEGSVTLTVMIDDEIIDAAQIFLMKGIVKIGSGRELNEVYLNSASRVKMSWAVGSSGAKFEKVVPDTYSVCVTPINGDMNDPTFKEKLQRHANEIAIYCEMLKVTDEPANQFYNAVVPPMKPLPED